MVNYKLIAPTFFFILDILRSALFLSIVQYGKLNFKIEFYLTEKKILDSLDQRFVCW